MEPIKIQELCRRFGVSSRTLRHWEDQGLLSSVRVGSGAIRAFDAAECERLEKILFLKRLDLPLGVIRSILTDGADVGAILREQRVYLASRAAEMRKRIALLEKVLVCIDADKDIFDSSLFRDDRTTAIDEADFSVAKLCVNSFLREDFETPHHYFGKRIASYMPPSILRYAWHEHVDPLGTFEAVEKTERKNDSVFVVWQYEKGRAIVQFVFTEHQVSGFWLTYDAEGSNLI